MGAVLLLGATSAIVAATAERLAARGDRLYVVGRDPTKLAAVVERLGPAVVGQEALDLCRTEAHAAMLDRAWEALGGSVDGVLIGHGVLSDQLATEADAEQARASLEVNLLSVVALLVPIANRMEAARRGTIGVITSVAGQRGRPRNYTYGAAKGALSVYLQGLRSRLHASGVRVSDMRPGPIVTPMTVGHTPNALFSTPEAIAPAIVRGLDRGTPVVWLPWYWLPIMTIVRWLPEAVFQRFGFLAGR
ncbi:MAG: SDR family NAD(P)-dependent oxidoreductase [Myxococcales bacterium]|nr:SDR family NAD(P)-dependent oxidoreductase [Myxococcales bacterium]